MIDRAPPSNLEAERSLLGTILLDLDAFDLASQIVRADDLYHIGYRAIWRAAEKLRDEQTPIDPVSIANELQRAGKLDDAGGSAGFEELMSSPWDVKNATYYAKAVRASSDRRRLFSAITEAYSHASGDAESTGDIIGKLNAATDAILEREAGGSTVKLGDVANRLMSSATSPVPATATGLHDLDNKLNGGFRPGQLIVAAARPGAGKTVLALQTANHIAKSQPVLFVSLEMGADELSLRAVASSSGIPVKSLTNGKEWPRDAEVAAFELQSLELHIDDSGSRTVSQIAAAARRLKRREGLGLVVVDYLQLMTPEDLKQVREQQVATMTRRLKGLARELSVPVLCLAQLNRAVESRDNKRPRLSDLRESGAIEQDADIVLMIHRQSLHDHDAPNDEAEVIVAKNRNGDRGIVALTWDGPTVRFDDQVDVPKDF